MWVVWKESYDKPRQHSESRNVTLPTKVCIVKAMVFPVVVCRCERWTIKKAKCQSIDAFELWCWGRLLKVPWIARRSNQSILKETAGVQPLQDLGEPEGKTASADDLERDKERIL